MGGIYRLRKCLRPGIYLALVKRLREGESSKDIPGGSSSGNKAAPGTTAIGNLGSSGSIEPQHTRDIAGNFYKHSRLGLSFFVWTRRTVKKKPVFITDRHRRSPKLSLQKIAKGSDALMQCSLKLKDNLLLNLLLKLLLNLLLNLRLLLRQLRGAPF